MSLSAPFSALVGADRPAAVAEREARNGFLHLGALSLTKIADGLVNPKLVLAWLLSSLGAPAAAIGALTPVREAGALLPQLAIARQLHRSPARKWVWAIGAALQGFAALGMAVVAATMEGPAAGWAIVGLLALLAIARAACSVTYKDALARTVEKTRRGAVTGAAASAASLSVLGFGILLAAGVLPLTTATIAGALALAGLLWLAGALLFVRLAEPSSEDEPASDTSSLLGAWKESRQLRLLIYGRALLSATALAPPFLIVMSSMSGGASLGSLGPLILASAGASILSAYVWGRLSDRSSRLTLLVAGALAAATLAGAAAFGWATGGLGGATGAAAILFVAQIAYEGVRAGRKLHLTDMTTDENRARFTAVSNTMVGVALLAGGGFGFLADVAGPAVVLAVFSAMCAAALPLVMQLDEVQQQPSEQA
ncbi:MAG: MFS transporter [Pseudomonadota bacterium]